MRPFFSGMSISRFHEKLKESLCYSTGGLCHTENIWRESTFLTAVFKWRCVLVAWWQSSWEWIVYLWPPTPIIGGICHKYYFCRHKFFVKTNVCLLWQNTSFVMTKVCLPWQNFCCNKHMYFCCDKRHVLSWQTHVCHDKSKLVVTKLFWWQKWYLWQFPPMINPCLIPILPPVKLKGQHQYTFYVGIWCELTLPTYLLEDIST